MVGSNRWKKRRKGGRRKEGERNEKNKKLSIIKQMIIIEILSYSSEFFAEFAKNHNFRYRKMAWKLEMMQKKGNGCT